MYDPVSIQALLMDPLTGQPILVLRSEGEGRILPIWIGPAEAHAIAVEMEKVAVPRPMTHDLLCHILERAELNVRRVQITDLRENTYIAEIVLESSGAEILVDARPSDAVAVAVRTGAPIFVRQTVFDAFAEAECGDQPCAELVQRLLLGEDSGELGQYKM